MLANDQGCERNLIAYNVGVTVGCQGGCAAGIARSQAFLSDSYLLYFIMPSEGMMPSQVQNGTCVHKSDEDDEWYDAFQELDEYQECTGAPY